MLGLALWAFGLAALAMLTGAAYQSYGYLKTGYWTPMPATEFCAAHLGLQWCESPQDWIGIHQMLSLFSPGGFLFAVSMVMYWVLDAMEPK